MLRLRFALLLLATAIAHVPFAESFSFPTNIINYQGEGMFDVFYHNLFVLFSLLAACYSDSSWAPWKG